jgi:hypothetical protein
MTCHRCFPGPCREACRGDEPVPIVDDAARRIEMLEGKVARLAARVTALDIHTWNTIGDAP